MNEPFANNDEISLTFDRDKMLKTIVFKFENLCIQKYWVNDYSRRK